MGKAILWLFFLLLFSQCAFSIEVSDIVDTLAKLNAEIEVRQHHLLLTPENDEEKTQEKLKTLQARENKLSQILSEMLLDEALEKLELQKSTLKESYEFSDSLNRICDANEAAEDCLLVAIEEGLINIILAFEGDVSTLRSSYKNIEESGYIKLNKFQKIQYETSYDVAFNDNGIISYDLEIQGSLHKDPTEEEIGNLKEKILIEITENRKKEIKDLSETLQSIFLLDEKYIEKKAKKRRLFGSF